MYRFGQNYMFSKPSLGFVVISVDNDVYVALRFYFFGPLCRSITSHKCNMSAAKIKFKSYDKHKKCKLQTVNARY